jgi:hypothetical protein
MSIDLTNSRIHRQNILNNAYAITKIQEVLAIDAMAFEGGFYLTKRQVAQLFDITDSTIERYLSDHREELGHNGYVLLRGKPLKNMKLEFGTLIDEGTKTTVLGIFSIRAVLNLAMLLVESDRAKAMRARMLDIVIDTIAQRSGGNTKYINQRDPDYLLADFQQVRYRKEFTAALNDYVDWASTYKYPYYTDKIYKSIFHEDAREYKKILQLADHENARDTMYAEVLKLIASYENGLAHELLIRSAQLGRKLTREETDLIFSQFESHPLFKPFVEDCRIKMASRDLHFRDALHQKLESYMSEVSAADFEKFLGEKSKALEDHIKETSEVFERLRDR